MKYGSLFAVAALALVAAAPPPPPPPLPQATPVSSPAPLATATASASPSSDTGAGSLPTPSSSALPDVDIFGNGNKAKGAKPKGSPSPPPDDRKGLDGVWEIAIQPAGADAFYEHFFLKQTGQSVAGSYLTQDKKRYPLAGAIDGTQIRMVVTLVDGSTYVIEGRLDGTTDMVGILTNAKGRTPFTAGYRPKEKWIDNVNASPGGLGGVPPR